MTTSIKQDARIWDLTLVVWLLVALSAVADAVGFVRLAPSFDLPPWATALAVIPIKLIEWRALTFGVRLWNKGWRGKLQSPVYGIVWSVAVALSALAAHATMYTVLATADYTATRNVETRGNLALAHQRISGQLDAFTKSPPRPMNTVEKDLAWANSVLRPPLDCTRAPDKGSRACKRVVELRKELAAATDYERLIREEQDLREKLASLKIEAANDAMPKAYETTIGQLTKMDGKNGIALMVTLILGLVSAFGPFGIDTLRELQVSPASPDAARNRNTRPEATHRQAGRPEPCRPETARPGSARPEPARPELALPEPALPEPALPEPARPEPARDGELALDHAHRRRPEGAYIIEFPSGQQGQEPCPPDATRSGSSESARAPAASDIGQTCKPAQNPAQDAPRDPPKGNVVQFAHARGRVDHVKAAAAVRAFVGMLETVKTARAMGSELAHAYAVQRLVHGWPDLPPNTFGIYLKLAVEERGGRKFKSGGQVYEGVRVPAAWREPLAQSA